MRSFAVWYQGKDNGNEQDKVKVDLHINLISGKDIEYFFLDFGFMIYDIDKISFVKVYCPFKINLERITDLVEKCNKQIITSMFNDDYSIYDGKDRHRVVSLNGSNPKYSFILYSLDSARDIKVDDITRDKKGSKGSIISIDLNDVLKSTDGDENFQDIKKYYIRFRIKVFDEDCKAIKQRLENKILLISYLFKKTEVIDFRINDMGSLSLSVKEEIGKNSKFDIEKIHYLILRKSTDVLINQGEPSITRFLEYELWEKYFSENIIKSESIIAYHFKKKKDDKNTEIKDFKILSRFQYDDCNIQGIFLYIIFGILLGIISGLIVNYLSLILLPKS